MAEDSCRTASRKVLFVSHVPVAGMTYSLGGGAKVLLELCRTLPSMGWKCGVVCPAEGRFVQDLRAVGAEVVVLAYGQPSLGAPLDSIAGLRSWLRLIKRMAPDVIHANAETSFRSVGIAAKLLGVPAVCHVHAPWLKDEVHARMGRWLTRGLPTPDGFIFVSRLQQDASTWLLTGRLRTVPSFVLHNAVEIPAQIMREPDAPPFKICIVGNLAPQKRHEDFFQVAQSLVRMGLDCRFVVVGGEGRLGGRMERLQVLCKSLGIAERVDFLGYRRDVSRLLAESHILMLTSESEGLPLVLAEGMATGRPVVCSIVGGSPEVVVHGQTGFLAEIGDVDKMAGFVADLIRSAELRTKMGEQGRRRAERCFAPAVQARGLAKIYNELLQGGVEKRKQ